MFKTKFQKTKDQSKKFIKRNYLLENDYKTILFIGSNAYKGTNNIFELCKIKKTKNTNKYYLDNTFQKIKERISSLKLENYIKVISLLIVKNWLL